MGYVNKISIGESTHLIEPTLYGTSNTTAETAIKDVTLTSFELITGAQVAIKFTKTNTAAVADLKLKFNGESNNNAKPIKYRGSYLPAVGTLTAGRIYNFVYDGTNWELVGDLDTNTQSNYGNITTEGKIGTGNNLVVTSSGTVQAGATISNAISTQTTSTKFLREDGTWATPSYIANRTYTQVSGKKPTGNQTPDFGSTFDIEQVGQDTTGQVSVTERTVKIPDTAASASTAGLVTTGTQTLGGGKTLKFTSRIYPLIGTSAERSQWYKITFPYSTITTGSSAQWFMNSFDLHFGGGYNSNPSGVAHVTFYWTRAANNGAWTVGQQAAFIEGTLANKIGLYYRIAEPGVLYVNNTANVYNGIWIDNLYVDDTAINLDWSTITIETTAAITESTSPKLSDYTKITTSYLYNDGGTLKTEGNFEGKYIKGTWLYTSAATAKTSTAKLATIESDNFIYYISPANALKSAIGTTAIGGTTTPIYWNGSAFSAGTTLGTASTHAHEDYALAGHNHDGVYAPVVNGGYLPKSGGQMTGTARITWADSGSWGSSDATFPNKRGGLYWSGTSDWIDLFAEETSSDKLNLVINFGDDTNPSLVLRDRGTDTITLTAGSGNITATTFTGSGASLTNLNGSNISSGTVSATYIDSAIARLASPTFTGTPKAPTAANGTSTTQIATTEFVNNTLAYVNAMTFKGTLGTGGTITALPATHNAGDTYRVITAGTWAGKYCEVGTLIICVTDGTSANDAHWTSVETNEDGAVIGTTPTSSTDNAIVRWDGASGRIIQDSTVSIADNGFIMIGNGASGTISLTNGGTWYGMRYYDNANPESGLGNIRGTLNVGIFKNCSYTNDSAESNLGFRGWYKNADNSYEVLPSALVLEEADIKYYKSTKQVYTKNTQITMTGYTVLHSGNTYAASTSTISIARNTETTIATINGTAIKIKIPASDNSWRPIGTGATDAMAGNTVVTNVSYTSASDDNTYPILMKNSTGTTTTAGGVKFNSNVTINPSTGAVTAPSFYGSLGYNYKTITVDGDAATYYPVVITSASGKYPATLVSITRQYNEKGPDTWNTSTHRGGLTCTFLWNNSRYQDGNGAGQGDSIELIRLQQTYCNMVGKISTSTSGLVVWLRGGGADYHIFTEHGTAVSVNIQLDGFTDVANQTFNAITTIDTTNIESYRRLNVTAATAVNLSAKPVLAASGNNITVTAGGKTSDAFTVPYATSAGSATNATTLAAPALNTETDIASGTRTYYGRGSGWTGSIASMQYAGILQICGGYSRGWQIWAERGAANSLRWRNPNSEATAWTDERIILDSGNYTNYTVTKTGTGASGTWGISITGSAAKIAITTSAPTSSKIVGYIPFSAAVTGNNDLYAQDSLYLYDTVTSSAISATYLNIGKNGSIQGGLTLHSTAAYYGNLVPATLGANRTWTLPNATGTIALTSSNVTSADSAKWLMNRGTNVTIGDSAWAHGITGRGGTNTSGGTVWKQKWTQSGLTYTPSGGSATTLSDSGDLVIWLSQDTTSNNLWANMAIDGYVYSLSGFRGGGLLVGKSEINQNVAAGVNSDLLRITNTRPAANIAANDWFWGTDFVVTNMIANTNACHVFGKANSTKNSGVLNYHHAGDASNDNYAGLGLYGVEDILTTYANRTVQVNGKLCLNRVGSASYGRISYYKSNYVTWFTYMSDTANGAAPTGGKPSTLGNITSWGLRTLIENASGYGWLWEAAANSAASANTVEPTVRMGLSSNTGQLRIAPNASSTSLESGGLIIDGAKNAGSGNVAIELWRGGNASWQIANEGGNLYIRNNWTTAKQTTYNRTSITVNYNTGNTTFAGSVTASGGFSGNLSGNATSASKISAKLATTTKTYLLGTATTITTTAANVDITGDTGVYLTTTAGELSAVRHSWNISGTEKAYTTYNSTDDSIDFVFI